MRENLHNTNMLWGDSFYDEKTAQEILKTGMYGRLYSADIHVSTIVSKNTYYMSSAINESDENYKKLSEYMKRWMRV